MKLSDTNKHLLNMIEKAIKMNGNLEYIKTRKGHKLVIVIKKNDTNR